MASINTWEEEALEFDKKYQDYWFREEQFLDTQIQSSAPTIASITETMNLSQWHSSPEDKQLELVAHSINEWIVQLSFYRVSHTRDEAEGYLNNWLDKYVRPPRQLINIFTADTIIDEISF